MTRLAKGKQSGELWDRVQLSNGIVGYAFQNYLKEVPKVQIEQINLKLDKSVINKGETANIEVEILPEEAKNKTVLYTSSNSNIAKVDSHGTVLGVRGGKVELTVKAKDNDVSSKIGLEVYSPVTDILLNVEDLMLPVGESFIVNTTVLPEDASNKEVSYSVEDESVIEVDLQGKITAKQEGTSKVIVKTNDNNLQKSANITVVGKIDSNRLKFHESLKIYANEISGWNDNEMTVEKIKEKIFTDYDVQIYNSQGQLLNDTDLAGTGSKIRILEDNKLIMEYNIVLYGDVNGDGKINAVDLLVLQRHILEIKKLSGVFLKAGNILKNGKNPSALDTLYVQRHILELQFIEQ